MSDTDRLTVEAICTMSMPTHYTGSVRCGHDHPSEAEAMACIEGLLSARHAALVEAAQLVDAGWAVLEEDGTQVRLVYASDLPSRLNTLRAALDEEARK